jgi:ERCC4-type nuclease
MQKTKCKLIIDTRERNILRHQKEFEDINHEVRQITTADYVVTCDDKIIAAIERKSLEDYAASIKDGRSDNKKKLIDLRKKTNCTLIYIIEGDAYPQPNDYYGNIPYRFIESSMFHLTVRDKITILKTRDTLGTASMLNRFMHSMDSLTAKTSPDNFEDTNCNVMSGGTSGFNEGANNTNMNDTDTAQLDIMQELTRRHVKSDHDVARELWSCFPGISVETADEYSKTWSIADIVCERIPRAQIQGFKMANGRKISKKVVNSLTGLTNPIEVRLLSCIEGVSTAVAKEITAERSLKALLGYGIAGISMIKVGKSKRSFGDEKATRLLRLFNYKYVAHAVQPTVQVPTAQLPAAQNPQTVANLQRNLEEQTINMSDIGLTANDLSQLGEFLNGI